MLDYLLLIDRMYVCRDKLAQLQSISAGNKKKHSI